MSLRATMPPADEEPNCQNQTLTPAEGEPNGRNHTGKSYIECFMPKKNATAADQESNGENGIVAPAEEQESYRECPSPKENQLLNGNGIDPKKCGCGKPAWKEKSGSTNCCNCSSDQPLSRRQENGISHSDSNQNQTVSIANGQINTGCIPNGQNNVVSIPNGQINSVSIPNGQNNIFSIPSGQINTLSIPNGQINSIPNGQINVVSIPNGLNNAVSIPNGQIMNTVSIPNGQNNDVSIPNNQNRRGSITNNQNRRGYSFTYNQNQIQGRPPLNHWRQLQPPPPPYGFLPNNQGQIPAENLLHVYNSAPLNGHNFRGRENSRNIPLQPPVPPYAMPGFIPPTSVPQPQPNAMMSTYYSQFPWFEPTPPTPPPPPPPPPPLYAKIEYQINHYFSENNLAREIHLKMQMDAQGWVPLSVIANFPKILEQTNNIPNIPLIIDAMKESDVVEIRDEKMRKRCGWEKYVCTFLIKK